MAVVSTTRMSSRQYLQLGEDPPGVRLELVNGEVAVSPSPFPRHAWVEKRLSWVLQSHIIPKGLGAVLGDIDTILGEYDVRRPDILYFTKEREYLIREDQVITGPPDLCVEILSPSSGTIDRKDKFAQYAAAGVNFYWIVDPVAKTIEAYHRVQKRFELAASGGGDETVSLPPFPDLQIPLRDIWFPAREK